VWNNQWTTSIHSATDNVFRQWYNSSTQVLHPVGAHWVTTTKTRLTASRLKARDGMHQLFPIMRLPVIPAPTLTVNWRLVAVLCCCISLTRLLWIYVYRTFLLVSIVWTLYIVLCFFQNNYVSRDGSSPVLSWNLHSWICHTGLVSICGPLSAPLSKAFRDERNFLA
jgi:hypothetical protein